jgi:hypothetical protein
MISRKKAMSIILPKKKTNTSYNPIFRWVEKSVISKRNYNAEVVRTIPRKSR